MFILISVSYICLLYLSLISVSYVCLLYLSLIFVLYLSYICLLYLSLIFVSYICLLYLSPISVSYICLLYLSLISVSYICLFSTANKVGTTLSKLYCLVYGLRVRFLLANIGQTTLSNSCDILYRYQPKKISMTTLFPILMLCSCNTTAQRTSSLLTTCY